MPMIDTARMTPHFIPEQLVPMFYWCLVRLVCFFFALPATTFSVMNRAHPHDHTLGF